MPLELKPDGSGTLIFSGSCTIEEADFILSVIRENPGAVVDLSAVEYMHTAVFQLIVASKLKISALPSDSFLVSAFAAFTENTTNGGGSR